MSDGDEAEGVICDEASLDSLSDDTFQLFQSSLDGVVGQTFVVHVGFPAHDPVVGDVVKGKLAVVLLYLIHHGYISLLGAGFAVRVIHDSMGEGSDGDIFVNAILDS